MVFVLVDVAQRRSLFNNDKQRLLTRFRPRRRLCRNTAIGFLATH